MISNYWIDRPVLVTGGASFIGSHLVEKLGELKAKVTVVDDLRIGGIQIDAGRTERTYFELRPSGAIRVGISNSDGVSVAFFHLWNQREPVRPKSILSP